MAQKVRLRAEQLFYQESLHHTNANTGILILISLLERRVQVLADRGINEGVPSGTWRTSCRALSKASIKAVPQTPSARQSCAAGPFWPRWRRPGRGTIQTSCRINCARSDKATCCAIVRQHSTMHHGTGGIRSGWPRGLDRGRLLIVRAAFVSPAADRSIQRRTWFPCTSEPSLPAPRSNRADRAG